MPAVSKILFVDDEVRVLDGLRDLLRKRRQQWDMHFAHGGESAMNFLSRGSYDVVVTDLRMPRIDGFQLLEHLRVHHPQTVRIALSGDPKAETALKAVPSAHRVLPKPCQLVELETALTGACMVKEFIVDEDVRRTLGGLKDLPPIPQTYARLERVVADERSSINQISDVIASDIAISAKILQLANSAWFGAGRPVTSVPDAILLIGTQTLKTMVLSSAVFGQHSMSLPMQRYAQELHEHSLIVARLASELAPTSTERSDTFAAGMLHDVGRMIICTSADPKFSFPSGHAVEGEDTHARVGAYLLGLWGVPRTVLDAVARHHERFENLTSAVTRRIVIAEQILEEVCNGSRPTEQAATELFRRVRMATKAEKLSA